MKARRVKHIDPAGTLADNLERIVLVRLDELSSFMPKAADPAEIEALHDMRIAAKRLRYILELGDPCFGPYVATATKRTKELQDLLGEIHDCDVKLPRLRALADRLVAEDALVAQRRAEDAKDVEPRHGAELPHASAHAGVAAMEAVALARRAHLFGRFKDTWLTLAREGFRARLEYAVGERPELGVGQEPPPIASNSPDDNGTGALEALPSAMST